MVVITRPACELYLTKAFLYGNPYAINRVGSQHGQSNQGSSMVSIGCPATKH